MSKMIRIADLSDSITFRIKGFDCMDCAAQMGRALEQMPGVAAAQTNYLLGKATVKYDPAQITVDHLIKAIKNMGYTAEEDSAAVHESCLNTTLRITGMDCADCASRLEQHVKRLPGVEQARVNFGAAKMEIKHQAAIAEILTAIRKMGYTGEVDAGYRKRVDESSIWNSNQHALPTLISLAMLALGLAAERMSQPALLPTVIFLLGIVLGGFVQARKGISVLIHAHELDMNILMIIAVIGAAAIGQFEEAVTVVFLFSLGNALQVYTLDKTRNSIRALMELTPAQALVRRNGSDITLPVEEIQIGDILMVRPGEKIAMDGRVVEGVSSVNQAPITGESLPVAKTRGDKVYAGTINQNGALEIETTHLSQDNTMARIINMVEEAQGQRAPSQQFVDRFARYYTPVVIAAAFLVALLPPLLLGQSFQKWFYEAMAMLLVACPCALIISTPVAIVSAIGSAARSGVLIKGGRFLEEMGALSLIAFDKTGTLTVGKPEVTDILSLNGYPVETIMALAAAIESRSEHPLAAAIIDYARDKGIEASTVTSFAAVPGLGAGGFIEERFYQIGKSQLFSDQGMDMGAIHQKVPDLQNSGKTVMILGDRENMIGIIAVADNLRDNSRAAVESLKRLGIEKTIMLTGDNQSTARAIAARAGIDEFKADLMPEDKVAVMNEMLAQYKKVAMVGDGVNDAPAMAISTVGIAMGVAGTDAALETADIALMADDLTKLAYAVQLSRKTLQIIRQNISIALLIKGLILLLVIPGWLTLWLAVAGDMGCSLLVTLNGMRLLRVKHLA
ncbi:MAG TPA: heavy metal translocating P-type ATPase [Syntrophomonadaceae bacterium]|nr:heavy metal translocating P-type ATPase [Syntrophomonadaceae bacterium]